MKSPQLDDGAIDEHFVAKIVDRAGGWEIRVFQHFFFVEPHFFRGLEQHQNMAGRARGNELVGDLSAKRTQKIEMADEERQMSIIGDGVERVDFEREVAPVLEKLAHDWQRQFPFAQLAHESASMNFLVDVLVKRRVEIVDVSFRFRFTEFFSGLGRFGRAHVHPLKQQTIFSKRLSSHPGKVKVTVRSVAFVKEFISILTSALKTKGRIFPSTGNRAERCRPPLHPLQGWVIQTDRAWMVTSRSDARALHDSSLILVLLHI